MKNAVSECPIARWVEQPSVFRLSKNNTTITNTLSPHGRSVGVPAHRFRGAGAPGVLTTPRSLPTTQRHRRARHTQKTAGPGGTVPNGILVLGKGPPR